MYGTVYPSFHSLQQRNANLLEKYGMKAEAKARAKGSEIEPQFGYDEGGARQQFVAPVL